MKLFGESYKITKPNSQRKVDFESREKCDGAVSLEKKHIRIYRYLLPPFMLETYIHEVLHIISDRLSISKIKNDEDAINQLAFGLSRWIWENGIKVQIR